MGPTATDTGGTAAGPGRWPGSAPKNPGRQAPCSDVGGSSVASSTGSTRAGAPDSCLLGSSALPELAPSHLHHPEPPQHPKSAPPDHPKLEHLPPPAAAAGRRANPALPAPAEHRRRLARLAEGQRHRHLLIGPARRPPELALPRLRLRAPLRSEPGRRRHPKAPEPHRPLHRPQGGRRNHPVGSALGPRLASRPAWAGTLAATHRRQQWPERSPGRSKSRNVAS
mmetsp:Transcript_60311/g.161842  ORF Transcript_60311/g.161842 Transcript_60311/m.161842 type:complete len:225 (+) Transcript_60311:1128-1802(+)